MNKISLELIPGIQELSDAAAENYNGGLTITTGDVGFEAGGNIVFKAISIEVGQANIDFDQTESSVGETALIG